MAKKLQLSDFINIATERGGACLSKEYAGCYSKLEWQCQEGHKWWAAPAGVKHGTWCPVCARTRRKRKKLQLSDFINIATERGGVCLSKEYAGCFSKLEWQCQDGHKWWAAPAGVKHGTWCPVCARSRRKRKPPAIGKNDLTTLFPEVAESWHPVKNGKITPQELTHGSTKKFWWICPKGHEWDAPVAQRTRGSGCPYCAGRRVKGGVNDLATTHPVLAREWHTEKNKRPKEEMMCGSHAKAWWVCSEGHEWKAVIKDRVTQESGCPYCSGRKAIPGKTDLETLRPKIAAEWDSKKNANLTPGMVSVSSGKRVWWKCKKKGHPSWRVSIADRTRVKSGSKCPVCINRTIIAGVNDLATLRPDLAEEFHETKNRVTPDTIGPGSNKGVWWKCSYGHAWRTSPNSRSYSGSGCPSCRKRTSQIELRFFTELLLEFPSARWGTKVSGFEVDVLLPDQKIAIEIDGYPWHSSEIRQKYDRKKSRALRNMGFSVIRIRDCRLPKIRGLVIAFEYQNSDENYIIQAINDLFIALKRRDVPLNAKLPLKRFHNEVIFQNLRAMLPLKPGTSLQETHPHLVDEWDHEKNKPLTPTLFSAGSNKRVGWICSLGHRWTTQINSRGKPKGSGCPYCNGKSTLKGFNDLGTKDPELALQWHPSKNGDLKPQDVRFSSNKKIWWFCSVGHEWEAIVNNRSKGKGCPYCSGREVITGKNDLSTVNPKLAREWHPSKNGTLTATKVKPKSSRKVWWLGVCGHEWESTVQNRSAGNGCPVCAKAKRVKAKARTLRRKAAKNTSGS